MRWRTVDGVKRTLRITTGVTGMLIACSFALPVSATQQNVSAVICGDNAAGATIDVTQPNDDSIVDQPVTTFRGIVGNATQIDADIDGVYAATVAVGFDQADFAIDLTLTEGTHTVTFTANDVCQQQDATDSVVITYQPASEPSDGGSTPTEVDGGTIVTDEPPVNEPTSDTSWFASLPPVQAVQDVIADISRGIGINSAFTAESATVGVVRVGLTVVAVSTAVMASTLAPVIIQVAPGINGLFGASDQLSRRFVAWILRGGALLVMGIVYFL